MEIKDMMKAWDGLSLEEQQEFLFIDYNFKKLSEKIHKGNEHWWIDLETGERLNRNEAELIALEHSELSEALEGLRKNLMDDKLPSRKNVEVELADCVIRILDHAYGKGYDVSGALIEKMLYNQERADHKPENRKKEGGKKF